MIERAYLTSLFDNAGITYTDRQVEQFEIYAKTLVEWNEKMNLTAITDPVGIAQKHFLDSALLLQKVSVKEGASLIDVGTGAGFPSVPCAILRSDIKLTLLDSLNKRITFLTELSKEIGVSSKCIHARAEEGGRQADLREKYDVATARAVAHMRELSEYCLPFVKVGGIFAALKGPDLEQELNEAKNAIKQLGGRIERVEEYALPDGDRRTLVVIKKISQTPTKFPRPSAKIKKQPLN